MSDDPTTIGESLVAQPGTTAVGARASAAQQPGDPQGKDALEVINGTGSQTLESVIPTDVIRVAREDHQRAIPSLAKNKEIVTQLESGASHLSTRHELYLGDSRFMRRVPDESVHLAVTSPPYWTLKSYPEREGQLGSVEQYEVFLDALDKVWRHVYRALVPGGRLVVVVGDVCLPRRRFGRHVVFPLHASIQERCRLIGFDNLAPIIWYKIANASYEVENGSRFFGKPYEPNGIVKNDIEFILFQRKPGGYRQPSLEARILSVIPESCHREWFQQIWTLTGESTRRHPAPFPVSLAERLVRMFSFVGDTVLDPFAGTGTTNVAAQRWGRNSIGFEIEPRYYKSALNRIRGESEHQASLL